MNNEQTDRYRVQGYDVTGLPNMVCRSYKQLEKERLFKQGRIPIEFRQSRGKIYDENYSKFFPNRKGLALSDHPNFVNGRNEQQVRRERERALRRNVQREKDVIEVNSFEVLDLDSASFVDSMDEFFHELDCGPFRGGEWKQHPFVLRARAQQERRDEDRQCKRRKLEEALALETTSSIIG